MAKKYGINSANANTYLTKCNTSMDRIKSLIGTKSGTGVNNSNPTSLIAAVEYLGSEIYDGPILTKAYSDFNSQSLVTLRKNLAKADKYLELLDEIAK